VRGAETVRGNEAAEIAQKFVGSPCQAGGISREGFDCSGFVRWVYSQQGIDLPRNSEAQARSGVAVALENLSSGDLVFFKTGRARSGGPRGDPRRISHVGIYIGGGRFVHAPKQGHHVQIDSLDDPAWLSRYAGARRPAGG
jgi:cell wall-associated NlpC family hydrolase